MALGPKLHIRGATVRRGGSPDELTCTDQLFAEVCTQFRVMVCCVPSASYTSMSDEIGAAEVPVPDAGVAGRFADSVTELVATGL